MKKFILRGLAVALTVLGFIGFLSVKPVKAAESNVDGFKIKGAAIRESNSDEDLMGLRFTTTMTQKAYNEIVSQYGGQTIRFGTEVTTTAENAHVQNFCYLSTKPTSLEHLPSYATQDESETLEFYAAITFNYVEFKADIERQLINNKELTVGAENYSEVLEACVRKYLQKAYATQLKATSYYQVGEGDSAERYYTTSLVRSMSMVANYYANTPDIDFKLDEYFYSKNYFEAGEVKSGYVTGDGSVAVFGLDVAGVTALAYNAEPLTFTNDGELKLDSQEITIPAVGEIITLYAFDANNKVTTLILESVNEVPTTVVVAGNEISNYKISVDATNALSNEIALSIQSAINAKTGLTLDLVGEDYDGLVIAVKQVGKFENGYREYVDANKNLVIEYAYSNKFEEAVQPLINDLSNSQTVEFASNYSKVVDISKVYYSEFGVVGDGVTNDFLAMKATHDFANISGQTVMGEAGMTYYIGTTVTNGVAESINIKTNVDWCDAKIVIDDTNITADSLERTLPVFNVVSSFDDWYTGISNEATIKSYVPNKTIVKGETNKLLNSSGKKVLLQIYDSTKKAGGRNGSTGGSLNEICLIDENGYVLDGDGNASSSTFLFDFTNVTSLLVYRADDEQITLKNASIQTLATQYSIPLTNGNGTDVGINRGITVSRSNVILDNIKHSVDNEKSKNVDTTDDIEDYCSMSAKYLIISKSANVTVQNCQFDGRMYYLSGTYDISVHESFNVLFKNCTQEDFNIDDSDKVSYDTEKWGVMGSHGGKYVTYDSCVLSRYDAHTRMLGGKVLNSKVATISVVGGGDLLIENCVIYARSHTPEDGLRYIITLRSDYGAFWNGTITLKDCRVLTSSGQIGKIFESNIKNYKYQDESIYAQFPNVVIDNLMIKEGAYKDKIWLGLPHLALTEPNILTYGAMTLDYKTNNYVYNPPEFITVQNNDSNGYSILVPSDNNYFTRSTVTGATYSRYSTEISVYQPIRQENGGFNVGWLNVSLA